MTVLPFVIVTPGRHGHQLVHVSLFAAATSHAAIDNPADGTRPSSTGCAGRWRTPGHVTVPHIGQRTSSTTMNRASTSASVRSCRTNTA